MNRIFSWSWIRRAFKYGTPVILLLLAFFAVLDAANRWPVAREALAKYPNQKAILIGGGYSIQGDVTERRAVYQLLPSPGSPPKVLEIVSRNSASVVVKDLQTGWVAFIFTLAAELLVLIALVVVWKRDLNKAPNRSLNTGAPKDGAPVN